MPALSIANANRYRINMTIIRLKQNPKNKKNNKKQKRFTSLMGKRLIQ